MSDVRSISKDECTEEVLVLRGAYGRQATQADWEAGKDFKIVNGPYCSKRDVQLMKAWGWSKVRLIRFDVFRNIVTVYEEAL